MRIISIKNFLNKKFPFNTQEKWDNSKINTKAFLNHKLNKVLVSLDINKKVIEYAIKFNCNLIISHHPLFIGKENSKNRYIVELKKLMKKNEITHIPLHTNYDISKNSVSFKLTKIISESFPKRAFNNSYGWIGKNKNGINDLIFKIKNRWNCDYLITDNINNIENFKFYFSSGAGCSEIEKLLYENDSIEVFISGEIKWHIWNLAKDKNKILIDVGHGIENFFIDEIFDLLNRKNILAIKYLNRVLLKNHFKN